MSPAEQEVAGGGLSGRGRGREREREREGEREREMVDVLITFPDLRFRFLV